MKSHIAGETVLKRSGIDENQPVEIVSPRSRPQDEDSIARSLLCPSASTDLASFLADKRKILVVVNDHTRPTPTKTVLRNLDLKGLDVTTIVATGAHQPPSRLELTKLFGGAFPPYGGRLVIHDSRDYSSMTHIGETIRGTELFFNSHLFGVDGIIVIGSVEPHYFAGFTGGRKFLLPGLAGFKSIERNHSLALNETARILSLEGNPVHEDFAEALNIFDRYDDIFSIQVVLNSEHKVCFTSSGDITQSFMNAVKWAKDVYVASIEHKADVVVSIVKPPMDLDLYQAQKAIENAKLALNDQGILILVSSCYDGIGDRGFYEFLASRKEISKEGYRLGYQKATRLKELQKKVSVWAVTDLPSDVLTAISIKPYRDIQKALDDTIGVKGNGSRVLTILDGTVTVPIPEQQS